MTRKRRHDDLDFVLAQRGRKKKRAARIKRRRRAGIIIGTLAIVLVLAILTVGLGAGAALSQSCDLNTLRPVEIGQNSFVFARDGSLLGSIPAERNREPVSLCNLQTDTSGQARPAAKMTGMEGSLAVPMLVAGELRGVIDRYSPDCAAVEDVFHAVNARSALKLAHVRGVALLLVAESRLQLGEYSPMEVKMSVVGYGRAEKTQVQLMVRSLLSLDEDLPEDASDAVAVAIFNRSTAEAKSTVKWDEIGLKGKFKVRDIWEHREVPVSGAQYEVTVPPHGVVLLRGTH